MTSSDWMTWNVCTEGSKKGSELVCTIIEKGLSQLWSLTQFYSVGSVQFKIRVKSVFFANTQPSFVSGVCEGILVCLSTCI